MTRLEKQPVPSVDRPSVSTRIMPDVLIALEAVAHAQHVTKSVYIARCIYQDKKIQQAWHSREMPAASPSDSVGLALALAIACLGSSLDRIAMNVEECTVRGDAVNMLRLVDEHIAIRAQLDELIGANAQKAISR